jgi:hypothetical protein
LESVLRCGMAGWRERPLPRKRGTTNGGSIRMSTKRTNEQRIRISGFGLLSDFGLRASGFSL